MQKNGTQLFLNSPSVDQIQIIGILPLQQYPFPLFIELNNESFVTFLFSCMEVSYSFRIIHLLALL